MAGTSPAMTEQSAKIGSRRRGFAPSSSNHCCVFAAWIVSLGPLPLEQARKVSATIVDRNGKLLRAYAMADGRWRLPVDAKTGSIPVT